jgi:hypothetical protein
VTTRRVGVRPEYNPINNRVGTGQLVRLACQPDCKLKKKKKKCHKRVVNGLMGL